VKKTWIYKVAVIALLANVMAPMSVSAAALTDRKVTLGSSAASASTTHKFDFTIPSTTSLGSIKFLYCTTASGSCTTPTGLTTTSATVTAQSGNSGFTIVNTTNGAPYLTRTASAASAVASSYTLASVTNPSTTNQTFYIRVSTYASIDTTGGVTDEGTVAASTANQITVTASVDETLSFCVYTGANCAAGGASVALGSLTASSTGSGTSKMDVATNGSGGYTVIYNGTTLTGPSSTTIPAMGTQSSNGAATTSAQGTSQFGLNLRANATPSVGADVTGTGSGAYGTNYGTADNFRHFSGDSIATASGSTNSNTFTVSYIANISGSQAAGSYTTTLTYIATATY
jgi:hypothetical protein